MTTSRLLVARRTRTLETYPALTQDATSPNYYGSLLLLRSIRKEIQIPIPR